MRRPNDERAAVSLLEAVGAGGVVPPVLVWGVGVWARRRALHARARRDLDHARRAQAPARVEWHPGPAVPTVDAWDLIVGIPLAVWMACTSRGQLEDACAARDRGAYRRRPAPCIRRTGWVDITNGDGDLIRRIPVGAGSEDEFLARTSDFDG